MNRTTTYAVLVTVVAWAGACFATPIRWDSNGHYYDVVPTADGITWDAARLDAANSVFNGVPGYLATITSQGEEDFIVGFGNEILVKWLGGFQPPGSVEPAGGWQWITGEPFVYTNWQHGEPNNSGGSENNLEIATLNFSPIGQWNDLDGQNPPAGFANGYIVEYAPEPSAFVLAALGIAGLIAWGWRRRRELDFHNPHFKLAH